MTVVLIVIAAVSALVAIFAAWSSARSAKAAERSVEQERAAYGLSAIREFILHEYLEREFRAAQAPEINGRRITLLREAKAVAKNEYMQNHEEWDRASRRPNLGAWQNQVAFETAWALEHLGSAAFAGILPLRVLLAIAGDVIIDDWLLCRSWVKSYRDEERAIPQVETMRFPSVYYHRRHAEWLVLVTVLWMVRHWSYPNCDLVAEWYGGKQNIPDMIRALSCADGSLISRAVLDDVRSLTGVEISL